jgi:hypothetical protein
MTHYLKEVLYTYISNKRLSSSPSFFFFAQFVVYHIQFHTLLFHLKVDTLYGDCMEILPFATIHNAIRNTHTSFLTQADIPLEQIPRGGIAEM